MLLSLLPASLQRVLNVPLTDVTDEQFEAIAQDLGFAGLHNELRLALFELVRGKSVHTAADFIQSPGAIAELVRVGAAVKAAVKQGAGSCDLCGSPIVFRDGRKECSSCGVVH